MTELAEQFDANRGHLRAVAYRMLGSLSEAEDAVQEAWLRLDRARTGEIENLRAWLTTVLARICLDQLRSRSARREEPLETAPAASTTVGADPETEAMMAESVGIALMVVLEQLAPAERLAFVLHDLFDLPFEEIARITQRTPAAARQLASRARRRVQGQRASGTVAQQRDMVERFLRALRAADLPAMLEVLDPDLTARVQAGPGAPARDVRRADVWAPQAIAFARHARYVGPATLDGAPAIILAPRGQLLRALLFTFSGNRITHIEVVADPERLAAMRVTAPPPVEGH